MFDYAPFAPTSPITLELVGRSATRTCAIGVEVLKTLRWRRMYNVASR